MEQDQAPYCQQLRLPAGHLRRELPGPMAGFSQLLQDEP
jgi:hypothetical protein